MKYYEYDYAPKNTPIYACAYKIDENNSRHILMCKPTKGMIVKDNRFSSYLFKKFKKDGTLCYNGVNASNRVYADTKEECKELYNELVKKRIMRLQDLIDVAVEKHYI